jgi:hypothetical protein
MIMSDESLSSGTKGAPRGEGDSLVYDTLHAIFSFHSNDDDRKFYMMNYGICAGEPGRGKTVNAKRRKSTPPQLARGRAVSG